MKWLKTFKEILNKNPDITDAELFRAFPELKSDPRRMDAALMYWKHDVIPVEFMPWWEKMIDRLWTIFK